MIGKALLVGIGPDRDLFPGDRVLVDDKLFTEWGLRRRSRPEIISIPISSCFKKCKIRDNRYLMTLHLTFN